jgi:hypothetical protein
MAHVSLFFASYEYFEVNQDVTPTKEFSRLKQLNGWRDRDREYREARERFADALAADFNATYGTDMNSLENWHALCHVIGIDPIPEGISACRKVRVWTNCVNLRLLTPRYLPRRLSSQNISISSIWFTTWTKSRCSLRSRR